MGEILRRKIFACGLTFFFLSLLLPHSALASESEPIFFYVDDQPLTFSDVKPEIKEDFLFFPVRTFTDLLGLETSWNPDTATLLIGNGEDKRSLDLTQHLITTSSGETIESNLYIKNGRVMVPLDGIAKLFSYEVSWLADGKLLRLKSAASATSDEQLIHTIQEQLDAEIRKKEMQQDVKEKPAVSAIKITELDQQANHQKGEGAAAPAPASAKKSNAVQKKKKVAYLTFDDGPTSNSTAEILDILAKYKVKATFFMLDGNVSKNQKLVKRIVEDGHAIGSHGVTHSVEKFYRSKESVLGEMKQGLATLKKVTEVESKLIRVPYGSKPHMKKEYIAAIEKAGYKMWDWNVDSQDWRYAKEPKKIIANTIAQVEKVAKRGQPPIILMHDKNTTAVALPEIIEYLLKHGYQLEPITNEMEAYHF